MQSKTYPISNKLGPRAEEAQLETVDATEELVKLVTYCRKHNSYKARANTGEVVCVRSDAPLKVTFGPT